MMASSLDPDDRLLARPGAESDGRDERMERETTVHYERGGGDLVQKRKNTHTPGRVTTGAGRERERKLGHRRVSEFGVISYKKKPSSELQQAIQLGIGQCVGSLTSVPERDVLMQDFAVVDITYFPAEGSNLTPAHRCSHFRFKTFAPMAFRYFRDLFGIKPADFMVSMCVEPLKELSNPGASGSLFYCSHDDHFIAKTVERGESEFLQKLLPGYFLNISQNKRTLLPKFYGLYCYMSGSKNIRFIVMNNLLPSTVTLHEKYDLKGSTYRRKASKAERMKETPTLKDLDFRDIHPEGLLIHPDTWQALIRTLNTDCRVLESFKIMDYSLLVGVYNLDQAIRDQVEDGDFDDSERGSPVDKKTVEYSSPMESIHASHPPLLHPGYLPCTRRLPPGGIPARNARGDQLLLYLGIIDILQSYRFRKRVEHTAKAVLIDRDTISVHKPKFYARRFLEFMSTRVFRKDTQAGTSQLALPTSRGGKPDLVRDTPTWSLSSSVDNLSTSWSQSASTTLDKSHRGTASTLGLSSQSEHATQIATPLTLPSPSHSKSSRTQNVASKRRASMPPLPLPGAQPTKSQVSSFGSQSADLFLEDAAESLLRKDDRESDSDDESLTSEPEEDNFTHSEAHSEPHPTPIKRPSSQTVKSTNGSRTIATKAPLSPNNRVSTPEDQIKGDEKLRDFFTSPVRTEKTSTGNRKTNPNEQTPSSDPPLPGLSKSTDLPDAGEAEIGAGHKPDPIRDDLAASSTSDPGQDIASVQEWSSTTASVAAASAGLVISTLALPASQNVHTNVSGTGSPRSEARSHRTSKRPIPQSSGVESQGRPVSINQSWAESKGRPVSINQSKAESQGRIVSINHSRAEAKGRRVSINEDKAESILISTRL